MFLKYLSVSITLMVAFATTSWAESETMDNSGHFVLKSTAFAEGQSIPKTYTCDGKKISPPLSWEGTPEKTKTLVLIVEDPNAPGGTWNHWVVYNIPSDEKQLAENVPTGNSIAFGRNSWGEVGYGPPCPPGKEHHYVFKLYALDQSLTLKKNPQYTVVENAMKNHILAEATLSGTYKR